VEKDKKKPADRVGEHPVTYEMYAEMPDDGHRYEIIEGKLEMMTPAPTPTHQAVHRELIFNLNVNCSSEYVIYYAPIDVIFSRTDVLQPDILLIHRSRREIVSERGIEGAPDLVVEILSPSSRRRDKIVKMKTYAKYGVGEYWIVDAASRTLEQHCLMDGERYELFNLFEEDDVVSSVKLPCVSFVIRDIFREIPG